MERLRFTKSARKQYANSTQTNSTDIGEKDWNRINHGHILQEMERISDSVRVHRVVEGVDWEANLQVRVGVEGNIKQHLTYHIQTLQNMQ